MTDKKIPTPKPLTNNQKKYLRGLGHQLTPLVYIGKEGLTDNVYDAIDTALLSQELVKVKIINTSSIQKNDASQQVPERTGCSLVQLIGKTLLVYRKNPKRKKEEQIRLPS
ncbi:MAG: ribosome assembly RNA-binding protein YhbY [Desulfocapsaceae bacterium]|jgi:RNA-binding protein|nr:ribosome assembly RNA-binding protein YhbY [Desulfocapsaceae bacterium]